jgi:hypothetical protein
MVTSGPGPQLRNGDSHAPAPKSKLTWRDRLVVWAALQVGGAATLLAVVALLLLVVPGSHERTQSFLRRWGTAFVIVPITFAPVLAAWHSWATRRFGRRPGFFRFVAEAAFAVELIAAVLVQRLA